MLKEDILREEKRNLECAVVLLQNRISEIGFVLNGGSPRPVLVVDHPTHSIAVPEVDTSPVKEEKPVLAKPSFARPSFASKPSLAPKPAVSRIADAISDDDDDGDDGEADLRIAEEEAEARGEKFVASTLNVSTKRVARLQKLLDPANYKHYNIVNGTKLYAVNPDVGSRIYLGKFSNISATGMPLPNGRTQFLFKTPELSAVYTGC